MTQKSEGQLSETLDEKCKKMNGSLQWAEDGILTVCALPRKKYEDDTVVLFSAKEKVPSVTDDVKSQYVEYFHNVYPSTSKVFWNRMPVAWLRQFYENLEIWYNFPGHPAGSQEVRSAFKPFYRVPDTVNLQQYTQRTGFADHTWIEVFHSGHMNTDFYIPNEMFAGTFYYPTKGSGVFLPLGHSLVALNKIDAFKKLGVPNDVILANADPSFLRWLRREEKALTQSSGSTMTPEEIKQLALDNQIKKMAMGTNKTRTKEGWCYYGFGSQGDGLLAKAALQAGYDTIQLLHEAQRGCDPQGVLDGFELIDLRNPIVSARSLRMAVPNNYFDSVLPETK
uniref:Uncharacterized protein n=1 Tax=viral metagenome TaxID=1070528 RepID=A0A6C0BIZ7_9ZZZZ